MYSTGMNVLPKEGYVVKMRESGKVYIVVDVWRGIAVGAYSFQRIQDALKCLRRLRKDRNLEVDDLRLFESAVNAGERQRSIDDNWSAQLSR